MVIDDQDYQAHFTDPDTLVSWDCVQQVVSDLIRKGEELIKSGVLEQRNPIVRVYRKRSVL